MLPGVAGAAECCTQGIKGTSHNIIFRLFFGKAAAAAAKEKLFAEKAAEEGVDDDVIRERLYEATEKQMAEKAEAFGPEAVDEPPHNRGTNKGDRHRQEDQ